MTLSTLKYSLSFKNWSLRCYAYIVTKVSITVTGKLQRTNFVPWAYMKIFSLPSAAMDLLIEPELLYFQPVKNKANKQTEKKRGKSIL